MVKSVLESIPVFWMSATWIPQVFLEKDRRICFNFLWARTQENFVLPWVKWEHIVVHKMLGGWGIKIIFMFSKALVVKCD